LLSREGTPTKHGGCGRENRGGQGKTMEAGKEKGLRGLQQHHQCSATSIVARQATEQPTSDLPLEPRDGSTVVHMRVEGLRSVKRKYEKKTTI